MLHLQGITLGDVLHESLQETNLPDRLDQGLQARPLTHACAANMHAETCLPAFVDQYAPVLPAQACTLSMSTICMLQQTLCAHPTAGMPLGGPQRAQAPLNNRHACASTARPLCAGHRIDDSVRRPSFLPHPERRNPFACARMLLD